MYSPKFAHWFFQVPADEAERRIREIQEPYKLEILQGILEKDPNAPITIYHIGETNSPDHWWDLCAGPHVPTTKAINPSAVELEKVSGVETPGKTRDCN
jgi:threonyl-tRNA synthetase